MRWNITAGAVFMLAVALANRSQTLRPSARALKALPLSVQVTLSITSVAVLSDSVLKFVNYEYSYFNQLPRLYLYRELSALNREREKATLPESDN